MTRAYEYYRAKSLIWRLDGYLWIPIHIAVASRIHYDLRGDLEGVQFLVLTLILHTFVFLCGTWWIECQKFISLRRVPTVDQAELVRVVPSSPVKRPRLCPILSRDGHRFVNYEHKILVLNKGSFLRLRAPVDLPSRHYLDDWKSGKESDDRRSTVFLLLPNNINIPVPSTLSLFKSHATAPLFVFQVACVFLWLLDEYWGMALMTLLMLLLLELQTVNRRRTELAEIRNVQPKACLVERVDRGNSPVSTEKLQPGNIIRLPPPGSVLPIDLLLLEGSAVMNEEMVTGESVPVLKTGLSAGEDRLNLKSGAHKGSLLLAGTTLVSCSIGNGNQPPIAHVLRCGFETTQGGLIRRMLYSSDRLSQAGSRETWKFLCALFVVAVFASAYVTYHGLVTGRSHFRIFLSVSHILTSVVPPEFPLVLSIAVTLSVGSLMRKGIKCTDFAKVAEVCDLVAFDKTGTVTENGVSLESWVEGSNELPDHSLLTQLCLAYCHSATLSAGTVVGDPIDIACIAASKNSLCISSDVRVVKIFPFDPEIRRMTVVVQIDEDLLVLSKGAPDWLDHVTPSGCEGNPACFACQAHTLTSRGYRVLAFRGVRLPKDSRVPKTRKDADAYLSASPAVALGGFTSKLAKGVKKLIRNFQVSGKRVIMITGDHPLTAVKVAIDCGMMKGSVALLDSDGNIKNTQQTGIAPSEFSTPHPLVVVCGTPKAEEILKTNPERVTVWARATPQDKEQIVTELKARRNFRVMFVGDGANDVAALRRANVGVACLSTTTAALPSNSFSPATLAAPFSVPSITSIGILARTASATRAAIVSNYYILGVNSLIGAFGLSVMAVQGVKLGDFQVGVEGVWVSILSFLASRQSTEMKDDELRSRRDEERVSASGADRSLSPTSFLNMFMQALIHACLIALGQSLISQPYACGGKSCLQTDCELEASTACVKTLDDPHQPNPLNALAFLQFASAHLGAFLGNACRGARQRRLSPALLKLLTAVSALLVILASGGFPPLNDLLGVQEFPGFEITGVGLVLAHLGVGVCVKLWL